MKKKYFDELLKNGVLTQEEYNDVFTKMRLHEDGCLIGVVPKEYYIIKYNLEGDMLQGNLTDFVKNHINPPYEFERTYPFSKYGIMICGIGDYWKWFTKDNINSNAINYGYRPIEEATEKELWQMIGMSSRYWHIMYQRMYYDLKEKK